MGQFPRGRVPSAEIGLTGQAQFGEESQSSLDRGSVNSGVLLLGVFGDSCGCKVASATAQCPPYRAPLAGKSITLSPQETVQLKILDPARIFDK